MENATQVFPVGQHSEFVFTMCCQIKTLVVNAYLIYSLHEPEIDVRVTLNLVLHAKVGKSKVFYAYGPHIKCHMLKSHQLWS